DGPVFVEVAERHRIRILSVAERRHGLKVGSDAVAVLADVAATIAGLGASEPIATRSAILAPTIDVALVAVLDPVVTGRGRPGRRRAGTVEVAHLRRAGRGELGAADLGADIFVQLGSGRAGAAAGLANGARR